MCSGNATLNAAVANQDVWGPAVTGNVIVIGNHPGEIALVTPPAASFRPERPWLCGSSPGHGRLYHLGLLHVGLDADRCSGSEALRPVLRGPAERMLR